MRIVLAYERSTRPLQKFEQMSKRKFSETTSSPIGDGWIRPIRPKDAASTPKIENFFVPAVNAPNVLKDRGVQVMTALNVIDQRLRKKSKPMRKLEDIGPCVTNALQTSIVKVHQMTIETNGWDATELECESSRMLEFASDLGCEDVGHRTIQRPRWWQTTPYYQWDPDNFDVLVYVPLTQPVNFVFENVRAKDGARNYGPVSKWTIVVQVGQMLVVDLWQAVKKPCGNESLPLLQWSIPRRTFDFDEECKRYYRPTNETGLVARYGYRLSPPQEDEEEEEEDADDVISESEEDDDGDDLSPDFSLRDVFRLAKQASKQ